LSRIFFFVGEALRALRRNAAPSVAAIVTIVVTTLLLGVLIPVLKASASKTQDVRSQLALRVFLYKDATKPQIKSVHHDLARLPHVTKVDYVSSKEALPILQQEVGKGPLRQGISQLNGKNPLPASFNIYPDDADHLDSIRTAITPPGPNGKPKPISSAIESISQSRQEANKIRSVTGAVKIILGVIALLLLVASLMLVANTIRLSIYARRREVEVMRLVGATNWFIRWPFVLEGFIVGLSGALLAVGILWLGKVTIVDPLANSFALVDNFSTVGFAPLVITLIAAAMAVSALGSGVTLRRFLRV
jgi:cell division transport system permease protein